MVVEVEERHFVELGTDSLNTVYRLCPASADPVRHALNFSLQP
jgi:hypothetical protein